MCTLCEIPLNTKVKLSVNWACCNYCNTDATNVFPRNAINLGFNSEGKHEFALVEKYTCACGYNIKAIEFCCGDDGCVVELEAQWLSIKNG